MNIHRGNFIVNELRSDASVRYRRSSPEKRGGAGGPADCYPPLSPLFGDVSIFLASPARGSLTTPGVLALFATESARTHAVVRERMSPRLRRTVRGMGAVRGYGCHCAGVDFAQACRVGKVAGIRRVSARCLSPQAIGCGIEILARPPTPSPIAQALKVPAALEWRRSAKW